MMVAAGVVAGACGSSQPAPEIRTVTVTRGAVTQTAAVPGSVNAAAQVRLNFKTTGKLAEIYVVVGQQVTAGQPLARLDTSDLEVSLAQAQAGLAQAQANYDQISSGATPEDIAIARQAVDNAQKTGQNDVTAAQTSLARLQTNFQASRSTLASLSGDIKTELGAFSLDQIVTQLTQARNDLNSMLNANGGNQTCTGSTCPSPNQTTQTAAEGKSAQSSLSSASVSLANGQSLAAGNLANAVADYGASADALVDIAGRFDAAVQSGQDTSQLNLSYQNVQSSFSTAATRLSVLVDQLTSSVTSAQTSITSAQAQFASTASRNDQSYETVRQELVPIQQALIAQLLHLSLGKSKVTQSQNQLQTLSDAVTGAYVGAIQNVASVQQRTSASVATAQNSLQKVTAPAKSYEIAASYASVLAQTANLTASQNNLANAVLKAPVPGVVASIANQVAEFASSGAAGFIVIANTSTVALHGTVGEADVAKLLLGQVATITVDAVGAARMTGKITSIDPVATIQQGVPVYGVDVTIDLLNPAVRPGMSGTANVIIANRQNTLVVPNLGIRNLGGRRYVVLLQNGQQVETDVSIGLINDTVTEILTGANEGDTVVLPQPRAGASVRPPQIGGGPPGAGR